jgi:bifunctional DNA-binding transcriptional regulator/antitoxin component of YhaV-PrlF toxin-antitoxin module
MTKKEISKIFLLNKISTTLIIPISIARKYGLSKSSHVIVEEVPDGILLKKLEV